MNNGEAKIDRCMPGLVFFIMHGQQWNSAFDGPEQEQATHQNSHPFKRTLLQRLKMIDDIMPHKNFFFAKVTKEKGKSE
jgi:hypothetical protein